MKGFVVRGKIARDHALLKIRAGDEVWLSWDNESGGWYQWSQRKEGAHAFSNKITALNAARDCPGPWYNMPSPESVQLFSADYKPARKAELKIGPAL